MSKNIYLFKIETILRMNEWMDWWSRRRTWAKSFTTQLLLLSPLQTKRKLNFNPSSTNLLNPTHSHVHVHPSIFHWKTVAAGPNCMDEKEKRKSHWIFYVSFLNSCQIQIPIKMSLLYIHTIWWRKYMDRIHTYWYA